MDVQDEQENGSLLEIVTTLQDLARLSHGGISTTTAPASTVAVALLERLLMLCRASRGAIFLIPQHSADLEPSLSPFSSIERNYRLLALHGANEDEVYASLTTVSSEDLWMSPPIRGLSWLHWRLPLTMSFPSHHSGNREDQERLDSTISSFQALLLFSWDGQGEENRAIAIKKASLVLPLVADAVSSVMLRVLSDEYINALEADVDRKALREMELLKVEWLATVSHELRSPLTSIKGYAATLLRHEARISREEQHEFLLAINEASDHLAGMIDSLLEMSEFEMGTIEIERLPINIVRLVREVVTIVEQQLDEANELALSAHQYPTMTIRLENHHGRLIHDELIIEADQNRLREALGHLLKNAITHSSAGGTINVVIRPLLSPEDLKEFPLSSSEIEMKLVTVLQRYKQLLVISVQDNGCGMLAKHLARIFDSFYRIDTRLTRQVNGLGLGLAISRRIIELHDGIIWAESNIGKGSTFSLCLPMTVTPKTRRASSEKCY